MTSNTKTDGFRIVADEIVRNGVGQVFTYTSDDVVELVAELGGRGVEVYHTRHEHVAVGMADGYARASGRLGVAIVGGGVGLPNAMNALMTAAKAHSRVAVLVGELAGGLRSAPAQRLRKYVDQEALLAALGLEYYRIGTTDAADVRAQLRRHLRRAHASGFLTVALPDALLRAEFDDSVGDLPLDEPASPAQPLGRGELSDIVGLLESLGPSGRVAIVAGRGAVQADAHDALERLADRTGALLGTTAMAREYFAGHPSSVGVVGSAAGPLESDLLKRADVVLAFGASLNYDTTHNHTAFGSASVVQIDRAAEALNAFGGVGLAVLGDAQLAAVQIDDGLAQANCRFRGFPDDGTALLLAQSRIRQRLERRGTRGGMDPAVALNRLDELLPDARTVVVDAGYFMSSAVKHFRVPDPWGFIWTIEHGAVGCALGAALGAAVARRDRMTVLVIGDGGLAMNLGDLDTAVRYGLNLLVVVCNNSMLGAEYYKLVAAGFSGEEVCFENPSFAAVAESLGYEATTAATVADLDVVQHWATRRSTPYLIDCVMTRELLEPRGHGFALARARQHDADM